MRPTKYTPELLEKARGYLENWKDFGDVIPSHVAFAEHIGISTTYVYQWAKEEGKEEFSDILKQIKARQERVLLNGGLNGDMNSNIVKLVLGKHGYHDKQDIGGDKDNPLGLSIKVIHE